MSDPKNLQHRVAVAFNAQPSGFPEGQDAAYGDAQYLHSLEPDPDDQPDEMISDRHSMMRYWLAGGGLLSCAVVLAIGASSGFTLLAIFLGAIGVASLLFSVAEKIENRLDADPAELPAKSPAPATVAGAGTYASGEMLASIHDALGDMTLCRTLSGTIIAANNTFREVMACDKPEGRSCEDLGIHFEARATQHSYDVEIVSADRTRIFLWHDVVTRDPMLGDLVVQSIARDVTDERQDARMREEARARAEEESGLKSRLIATVSHEIRTPLSGLLGMGHLLAGTRLSAEQKSYLDGIRQSGTALVQLVEDLLDFSTLAAGRFQLKPREEAIRPLVESMVEMLSAKAHAKGIELGACISPDLPEFLTFDPARFRQVLFNVIGNAVKFTERGGVLVSVSMEGAMLQVKVSDTGPGMNETELQRIFGEFEQGDLSRAREGGVGLGLAISARIMAEAGGALVVESGIGKGSAFTIRLPVKSSGRSMRSGSELSSAKVLLLAPVGPAATALLQTLDRLGAEVHLASTAEEVAITLEEQGSFTGVIVDHRLDSVFCGEFAEDIRLARAKKVYLVNPESRPASISGNSYDSWLIRPLREQSLIDVLTGKLKGLEPRAAANDDFPVLSAELEEEADLAEQSEVAEDIGTGLSILLGEDDPVNAMIAQAILEKAGHRVRLADNFARLEAMLAESRADLILTDYAMPDGTSESFIARLRENEEANSLESLPVIVLTADGTDETRRKLLLKGADLVLIKPAGPEILTGAIMRLASRHHRAA